MEGYVEITAASAVEFIEGGALIASRSTTVKECDRSPLTEQGVLCQLAAAAANDGVQTGEPYPVKEGLFVPMWGVRLDQLKKHMKKLQPQLVA
jgi:hypothetical protein